MYHLIRVVVVLLAALTSCTVGLTLRKIVREEGGMPPSAMVLPVFVTLFWYWAWYINAGRRRFHFWLATPTFIIAAVVLYASVHLSGDRPHLLLDYFQRTVLVAPFALGLFLRQPRIRAARIEDARRRGDLQALIAGLTDRSVFVRCDTARMLGEMGPDAVEALPELNKSRYDPSPRVRRAVTAAVERITPREDFAGASPPSAAADANPYRSPAR